MHDCVYACTITFTWVLCFYSNVVLLVPTVYNNKRFLHTSKVVLHTSKIVTGVSVHWTYSSSCSSAISDREAELYKHNRSSISSVVELTRFLVNHGGLLN